MIKKRIMNLQACLVLVLAFNLELSPFSWKIIFIFLKSRIVNGKSVASTINISNLQDLHSEITDICQLGKVFLWTKFSVNKAMSCLYFTTIQAG